MLRLHRHPKLSGALVAATCAALMAAPVRAEQRTAAPDDAVAAADAHLKRGVELFAAHQYEAAIAEFEAGNGLDPRPDFLFALAQAERLSGDCASAILYYREFLASQPSERQAEAARANLNRCEHVLSTSRASRDAGGEDKPAEPAPPPTAAPESEAEPLAPIPPPPDRGPWYTDVLGDALLGGGLVIGAAGGFFWLQSSSSRDDALDATAYDEYESKMDDARSQRAIAIGAFAVGGALVTGAVVRYLTRGDGSERATVAVQPASGGVVFGIAGGF
jgi:tetratricopeptide (TPR) repeat protein